VNSYKPMNYLTPWCELFLRSKFEIFTAVKIGFRVLLVVART